MQKLGWTGEQLWKGGVVSSSSKRKHERKKRKRK
jgi:hypothetical protein